jgi:hypothetical protein
MLRTIDRQINRAFWRPFLSLRTLSSTITTKNRMAIELVPLPLPASADPSKFGVFGREVKNVDPGNPTPEQLKEIEEALYKVRSAIISRR